LRLNLVVDLTRAVILAPFKRLQPSELLGNHIIIETRDCYVLLAHLKQGSIRVAVGDRVVAGQPIAAMGNSGNSTFPHLHVQAMDRLDLAEAKGLPLGFTNYDRHDGSMWVREERGMPPRGTVIRLRPSN